MNFKKILLAGFLTALTATASQAVTIVGYDIRNADRSGSAGWSNTYDGEIGPSAEGIRGLVDLTGGSGTLNDGIVPDSIFNNQLFISNFSLPNASITLYFDGLVNVGSIEFVNSDFFGSINSVPSTIASATATVGGGDFIETVAGIGFGAVGLSGSNVSTRFDFSNSVISEFAVDSIRLSNFFVRPSASNPRGTFSIGEVIVNEPDIAPVPLPASGFLLIAGLGGMIVARRRKVKSA